VNGKTPRYGRRRERRWTPTRAITAESLGVSQLLRARAQTAPPSLRLWSEDGLRMFCFALVTDDKSVLGIAIAQC